MVLFGRLVNCDWCVILIMKEYPSSHISNPFVSGKSLLNCINVVSRDVAVIVGEGDDIAR